MNTLTKFEIVKFLKKFKQIEIDYDIDELSLKESNCFLFNHKWQEGGYFNYGNDKGFGLSNGAHYNTLTGDCLYDQITINGFKVYKPIKTI